jgi:hypothetical protein
MVDNIKLNKVLPSLSSAPKVKRMDRRSGKDRQNQFEDVLKEKRRKKKKQDDSEPASIPADDQFAEGGPFDPDTPRQAADEDEISAESPSSRIIDIRV